MHRFFRKAIVLGLVPSMALFGVALPAHAAKEVTCESSGMRRTYCGVGQHGDIRLVSTMGSRPCRQNETWGVESEGIWVDQNCRARFSVDDPTSNGNGNGNNNGAAIAVGVIGLAAIAALAARNRHNDDPPPPDYGGYPPGVYPPGGGYPPGGYPTWMIGRYGGYSPQDQQNLTVDIGPSGRVMSVGNSGRPDYGRVSGGDQITFDNGVSFYVQPASWGIRLIQVQDQRHRIELRRQR